MNAPSTDITNSSALQLYSTAYRYQYEQKDIKEACRLYREIIRQFPDSNESSYAVVQLEKIGAQEAIKSLQGSSWQRIFPIAALLFSLIALLIAGTALLLVLDKNQNSWYNNSTPHFCCFDGVETYQSTIFCDVLRNVDVTGNISKNNPFYSAVTLFLNSDS